MPGLIQDLRHALRALATHPGYFAIALLTLAIGIGFNTAIFTVVNAVLLEPLPYPHPEELVVIRERRLPQFPEFSVAPGNFLSWQSQSTVFQRMAAFTAQFLNLDPGDGEVERVRADRTTVNLFAVLGVQPAIGRALTEADDRADAPRVAVISHTLWQRRFGADGGVLGRVVRLGGRQYTIVGVMPKGFAFPAAETEMWVPMMFESGERQLHGSHYLSAIARLKTGIPLERADAELQTIAKRLSDTLPASNDKWEALPFSMHQYLVRDVRRALLVLLGAVAFVLLIACVNVANLLLARGASRHRELAIRAALGARRMRLVRQLLAENLVLGAGGAAAGLLIAGWLLRVLLALIPGAVPREADIALDRPVLLFTLALSVLTPFVFGLVPAMYASRTDLRTLLAAGGRQGASGPGRRTRTILVVAEIALALMLLVGAGLLIRSFASIQHVAPGFVASNGVIGSITLPPSDYPEPAQRTRFFADLITRAEALPQVEAAGVSQSVPLAGDFVASFSIEGRPVAVTERPTTNFYAVSPGYFAAMGIALRRGRTFTDNDATGAPRVAIVNETLARKYFPGEDPIGKRIKVSQGPGDDWREIVGVVGDVTQYGLTREMPAQVYESYRQHPYFSAMILAVRTRGTDPAAVVPELRAIVRAMDKSQALSRVRTLDEILTRSLSPQRFSAVLLGVFSGAALLLAAVGLYGVLAYAVGQRTQEIAIRIAHGATRGDILRLVLSNGLAMSAGGVGLGLAGAVVLRRLIAGLLFGVSAGDPSTYAVVALLLTVVTLAASAIPALRATRVDPLVALRGE